MDINAHLGSNHYSTCIFEGEKMNGLENIVPVEKFQLTIYVCMPRWLLSISIITVSNIHLKKFYNYDLEKIGY